MVVTTVAVAAVLDIKTIILLTPDVPTQLLLEQVVMVKARVVVQGVMAVILILFPLALLKVDLVVNMERLAHTLAMVAVIAALDTLVVETGAPVLAAILVMAVMVDLMALVLAAQD